MGFFDYLAVNEWPPQPHWEHGYRCHGYWLGVKRIGYVSIGPGRGAARKYGYRYSFDLPTSEFLLGQSKSLIVAKKAVELAWKRYVRSIRRDILK
jgi:hypothetical protein